MNAEAWVALGVGILALGLNGVTLAVGYGVLKGQVTALAARVFALEGEMSAITELKVKVAEIATRQDTWIEQLKELNSSIRWMRQPQDYEPEPPRGGAAPRRRSST